MIVVASGFGPEPQSPGIPGWFVGMFLLVLVLGIGTSAIRYVATRDMAKRRGASDQDASTVALFGGEVGTAAAYLKDAPRTVEDRVREVRELEAKGLITAEQATARVDEILRSV